MDPGRLLGLLTGPVRAVAFPVMTRHPRGHAALLAGAALILAACGSSREEAAEDEDVAPAPVSALEGTATWRERMALPPGAVLEATVEDVSQADAPAEVLGRTRLENPGNPPVRFEIPYDPSLVDPARRYTVRARITVEGKPLFITDRHYPVLGAEDTEDVELVLRRAGTGAVADESLENTYWRLTHLDGAPIPRALQQAEPHLIFNSVTGRVTGSGGCNRVGGTYRVTGDRLELSRMVGTLMACEQGMETERALLQALEQVRGWRISGWALELVDEEGRAVARFEGTPME